MNVPIKKFAFFSVMLFVSVFSVSAQDPHYSQFFMAPHLMNPANSGTGEGDWRLMSNFRQQWSNVGAPFSTFHLLMDGKLIGREEEANTLGASLGFLTDQSLNGAFSSTYVSGSVAYHLQLASRHRFGLGMLASYGQRRLDYSELTFGEQFTSGGFDVSNLPSGETALSNMKPFLSLGAGLRYEYRTERLRADLGSAVYHVNKPKQSFLSDPLQVIPLRINGQFNLDYSINERLVITSSIVYQQQASQSYFSVGGAIGMDLASYGERSHVLFVGSWYRESDAVYPFVALQFGQAQIGVSYDVTLSKQNQRLTDPRSFELSLVLRQRTPEKGTLFCPNR